MALEELLPILEFCGYCYYANRYDIDSEQIDECLILYNFFKLCICHRFFEQQKCINIHYGSKVDTLGVTNRKFIMLITKTKMFMQN